MLDCAALSIGLKRQDHGLMSVMNIFTVTLYVTHDTAQASTKVALQKMQRFMHSNIQATHDTDVCG